MQLVHHVSRVVASLALALGVMAVLPPPVVADEADPAHGRMVLVLDSSGSMAEKAGGGGTKMQAAKTALTEVVGDLPAESEVGLRVYGAEVFSKDQKGACTDSQLVVPLGTDNRTDLETAIKGFKPYGETPIAHALEQAAQDLGEQGKRSIVLVSDGIATCQPDPCEVAADLAQAGIDLQIDVVGLGVSGRARNQLQCIASKGNGTYYNVDSADEITRTLTRVSQRAVRPFTLTGTPVEGTGTAAKAPTITEGQWTDVLGGKGSPEAVRHYRVQRTIPRSTLHVVATTRGTPGQWDEVGVTLTDPMGDDCSSADDHRTINQYAILSAQTMAGREGLMAREECWRSEELGLVVERGNDSDTEQAPIAITVFEEPPARDVDSLPEMDDTREYVAPQVSGTAEKVVPGTGFADAPRLTTGMYELDIVPGESQIMRVPLDWGQQFTMRAVFPKGTPGVEELTGVQGPFADVKMYSSLTGAVTGAYVGTDGTTILPGSSSGELTAMSPVVRYRNREAYGGPTGHLPGDYYLVISANASHDGDSWVQPYKLAVEVLGEPNGAPTYADAATVEQPLTEATSAEVRSDETPEDAGSAEDQAGKSAADNAGQRQRASEEGLSTVAAMGLGAGGVLVVLAGTATALLLLRRRGT